MRPTAEQIAEYTEMVEAGIAVEAALEEAFPDQGDVEMVRGRPARLKTFFTVTDDGLAVAWDTCGKCHQHISLCKCKEIKIPEYIERWAMRRRGMVIDSVTGKAAPAMLETTRTPVVVTDALPLEGCISCGQRITPAMAHVGAYVEMDADGATTSPYAIEIEPEKWKCSDCINPTPPQVIPPKEDNAATD